jgi:exodeoxyribonuclease V alpha subunit
MDESTGEEKNKMNFEPTRNAANPLPTSIRTIIFEESSMIGTDLYKEVINACPHNPQLIFLGDIQQLPPVFGPAILGFKLLSLPVVELTEVYRQALESPIISLAHRILSGNPIPASEYKDWKKPGQLTIHPWKKKISAQDALNTTGQFFIAAEKSGGYNPEEDIILLPFNKSFGTEELNKIIANHLAKKREGIVHEVVAGFVKHYYSVGDKVMYEKEDAVITGIEINPAYTGAKYLPASSTLDYWGYDPVIHETTNQDLGDVDFLLAQVAANEGERVHQASHTLKLRMLDSEIEVKIDKAAEINSLLLGYALTVHKSQGSEWTRVFFVTHQSHATMLQRELLYTAVTRAKEELYIICEPETFTNGIRSQRVKGDTLAEKAEFFKGKVINGETYE